MHRLWYWHNSVVVAAVYACPAVYAGYIFIGDDTVLAIDGIRANGQSGYAFI
jgi:hypothetical protein